MEKSPEIERWPLRPLLQDENGEIIRTPEQWQRRADAIRRTFQGTLGEVPASQYLHGFELDRSGRENGVVRTLMRIEMDEDDVMEAWLIEPDKPAKVRRVALALHQTADFGKDEVAGLAGKADLAYGLELARRGWTVLAPDQLGVTRRYAAGLRAYETRRFYERFPKWSAVGKTVRDAQIALDVLGQLPQTAAHPVNVIGHSLGGSTALFLAASDERIQQVVCNCGLYPHADSAARANFFRTGWYIYFKDQALKQSVIEGPVPLWDYHEIGALIAPRRLWLGMSVRDPHADATWGLHQISMQLHELYRFLQADSQLTCVLQNQPHDFPLWDRQYAYHWLEANESGATD